MPELVLQSHGKGAREETEGREKRREEKKEGRAARCLGKLSCLKAAGVQQRRNKGKRRKYVLYSKGVQAKGEREEKRKEVCL